MTWRQLFRDVIRDRKLALKREFRRLLGRCGLCGGKRAKRNDQDIYTYLGPYCRSCNKRFIGGRLYGGGVKALRRAFTQ